MRAAVRRAAPHRENSRLRKGGWRNRAQYLARAYRGRGTRAVAFLLAQRACRSLRIELEWFTLVAKGAAEERPQAAGASDFIWASPSDVRELAAVFDRSKRMLLDRFAAGDRCAVMARDGEIVACIWFRTGAYQERGLIFEPGREDCWIFDAHVVPDHRGERLFTTLWAAAAADLAREGVTRIVGAIDVVNQSSMKAAVRHGARPFCSIIVVGACGVRFRRERRSGQGSWSLYGGSWPVSLADVSKTDESRARPP